MLIISHQYSNICTLKSFGHNFDTIVIKTAQALFLCQVHNNIDDLLACHKHIFVKPRLCLLTGTITTTKLVIFCLFECVYPLNFSMHAYTHTHIHVHYTNTLTKLIYIPTFSLLLLIINIHGWTLLPLSPSVLLMMVQEKLHIFLLFLYLR